MTKQNQDNEILDGVFADRGDSGFTVPAKIANHPRLECVSYKNDACPCYIVKNSNYPVTLWVDHKDPAKRENEGMIRFGLMVAQGTSAQRDDMSTETEVDGILKRMFELADRMWTDGFGEQLEKLRPKGFEFCPSGSIGMFLKSNHGGWCMWATPNWNEAGKISIDVRDDERGVRLGDFPELEFRMTGDDKDDAKRYIALLDEQAKKLEGMI